MYRPIKKEELKKLLSATAVKCRLSDIEKNMQGRMDIKVTNCIVPIFILPSAIKKLYVFLSAVGNPETVFPRFHRPSWSRIFNGVCLFVDDPARKFGKFAPAFYFGTEKINVVEEVYLIVSKIQNLYGIKNQEVCFISSSNGGFASLYLCDKLKDSSAITLNAAFSIPRYLRSTNKLEAFQNAFNINFDTNNRDILQRSNVFRIKDNKRSKFFIYLNIGSRQDKIKMESFFNKINIAWEMGLNIINKNLWIWIVDINDSKDPHLIQPNEFICKKMEELINSIDIELSDIKMELDNLAEEIKKDFCDANF